MLKLRGGLRKCQVLVDANRHRIGMLLLSTAGSSIYEVGLPGLCNMRHNWVQAKIAPGIAKSPPMQPRTIVQILIEVA